MRRERRGKGVWFRLKLRGREDREEKRPKEKRLIEKGREEKVEVRSVAVFEQKPRRR